MSTLADPWRSLVYSLRSIPSQFGLRQYSVSVLIGTWSKDGLDSGHVGDGELSEQVFPILENGGSNPKVRFIDEEQRILSGLSIGSCEIGPITPDFGSGGTPLSLISPKVSSGEQVHILITGPQFPDGAKFSIKKIETSKALHWTMLCEPVSVVPQ